jgi:creatinine amidohydrolase
MFAKTSFERWWESGVFCIAVVLLSAGASFAQEKLPVRWEELTGPDFVKAIAKSQGTCMLPFGILEKHGPSIPIGTDLIGVQYMAVHAAEQEYTIVFPEYYFGQINEGRPQPGAIALSAQLQLTIMQAVLDEMARNGCKKIIIANGHGGNPDMLRLLNQDQMQKPRDYILYVYLGKHAKHPGGPPVRETNHNQHAGERETSMVLAIRPDLVHMDVCGTETGESQARTPLSGINGPPGTGTDNQAAMALLTPVGFWYADFPNHYDGHACWANKELGEFLVKNYIQDLVEAIRVVKADEDTARITKEFYERAADPIDTPQTGTWWIK